MQPTHRLRRSEDFARLRERGRTVSARQATLSYGTNDLPHNRYGFIVSKRLGKAVVRNRVRRRLREAMRALHPTLVPGYDLVIIARAPQLGGISFAAVQGIVADLVRRAGLVEGSSPS